MSGGRDGAQVCVVGQRAPRDPEQTSGHRGWVVGKEAAAAPWDRDQLSTTHCRTFAGSQDHSLPVAIGVTQYGALRHTVAGGKKK